MSSTSKRSDLLFPLSGNRRLAEYIRSGGDGQAVVLCGPAGSGRHTAAWNLAAAAVCAGAVRPCGQCPACRKVRVGEHQDVQLVSVPEDKSAIPVERIREIRGEAYIRPGEAENKVYIIESAETLQVHAQNALLKVLEEPPAHARFILITGQESALLPTVLSRCRIFRMEPLSPAEGEALLGRLHPASDPEARAIALAAAEGYVGPALARLTDDRRKEHAIALDLVRGMLRHSEREMLAALTLPEKTQRDRYAAMLDCLTELLAAALERKYGREPPGIAEESRQVAAEWSIALLLRLRDIVEAARDRAKFNIQPLTAALALCAELAGALSL